MNMAWTDVLWFLVLGSFFFMMMRKGGCCGSLGQKEQRQKSKIDHQQ